MRVAIWLIGRSYHTYTMPKGHPTISTMLICITELSFSIHFSTINAGYLIVTVVIFKYQSYHDAVSFFTWHDCIASKVIFKYYRRQSLRYAIIDPYH